MLKIEISNSEMVINLLYHSDNGRPSKMFYVLRLIDWSVASCYYVILNR
jgi:hypothetical protein